MLTRPLGAARSWREGVPALIVAPDQLLHFLSLFLLHSSNIKPVSPGFAGDWRSQRQQEAKRLVVSCVQCQVACPTGPFRWPVFMIRHVHTPGSCPRGMRFSDSLTAVRPWVIHSALRTKRSRNLHCEQCWRNLSGVPDHHLTFAFW